MPARLNVTEAERLSYSRRKLQAISALRNADLSAQGVLHGKVQRSNIGGRFYCLTQPDGSLVYFPALRQVIAFAKDYRLYTLTMTLLEEEERISWKRWQTDGVAYALALLVPELRAIARQSPQAPSRPTPAQPSLPAPCSWQECPYPATGFMNGRAFCAGHAYIYRIGQEAGERKESWTLASRRKDAL